MRLQHTSQEPISTFFTHQLALSRFCINKYNPSSYEFQAVEKDQNEQHVFLRRERSPANRLPDDTHVAAHPFLRPLVAS